MLSRLAIVDGQGYAGHHFFEQVRFKYAKLTNKPLDRDAPDLQYVGRGFVVETVSWGRGYRDLVYLVGETRLPGGNGYDYAHSDAIKGYRAHDDYRPGLLKLRANGRVQGE